LQKDHTGSTDGDGLLGHILDSQQERAEQHLGEANGLSGERAPDR
jgi:hypothetical protein